MTTPTFDDRVLTDEVVRSLAATPDPRTHQLLARLVVHLHAYVRDVGLSFAEWQTAIDFLTRTGHMSGPTRQEFILLSDVLGVSMLVDAIEHRDRSGDETQTTVLGPFYVGEHRPFANGGDLAIGQRGDPLDVAVTVRDLAGAPIAGATLDVWHANADGLYDSQQPGYTLDQPTLRGRFTTGADGRAWFRTIVPCSYPIPVDGPVGELLRATKRHPMRPAHIHFYIRAPGKAPLVTHVFIAGDDYLHSDTVFGVKPELIAPITAQHELTFAFTMGDAS